MNFDSFNPSTTPVNIFLDDIRAVPDDGREWILCKTAAECIELLQKHAGFVDTLSLDHDLGEIVLSDGTSVALDSDVFPLVSLRHSTVFTEETGYTVAKWIESEAFLGNFWHVPGHILCHSANPVGRRNILRCVENIRKIVGV